MNYFLVLQVPLDAALVSRASFDSVEKAEEHRLQKYPDFPAMEVLSEEEVRHLTSRVVRFPEKKV